MRELKLSKRAGIIKDFTLQPEFVLLESFKKFGETVRGIKYRADFKIIHKDGSVEIIDVKGFQTKDFKLKQKLFDSQYPELKLVRGDRMQVQIIDTRPEWMVEEDGQYKCLFKCREYRYCTSRVGASCRKLGGDIIPKIRRGK